MVEKFAQNPIESTILTILVKYRQISAFTQAQLTTIADGLISSKLRYMLPMFAKIRISENDPIFTSYDRLQVQLNKVGRLILNKNITDKISRVVQKYVIWASVNRQAIKTVVLQAWKSLKYGLTLEEHTCVNYNKDTRAASKVLLKPKELNSSPFVKMLFNF